MKQRFYAYMLATAGMAALLAGCGAGGTSPETKNTLHESTACISCHEGSGWVTPGTEKPVVAEWKLSTHMTANGAGCADCHDDGYMHPTSCSKCHNSGTQAKAPTTNPDRDGKCAKCHDGQMRPNDPLRADKGFKTQQGSESPELFSNLIVNSQRAHFNNITSGNTALAGGGYSGSFVSSKYLFNYNGLSSAEGNCRKCHGPHDPTSTTRYNQDWARSGHGTTTSLINRDPDPNLTPAQKEVNGFRLKARNEQDFKLYGSAKPASLEMSDSTWSNPTIKDASGNFVGVNAVCVRCHTTTGFINFVSPDPVTGERFSNISPFEGPGFSSTKSRDEILRGINAVNTPTPLLPAGKTNSKLSNDLTKQLTSCDGCHVKVAKDTATGKTTEYSYDFTQRRSVPAVKVHYNFAGRRSLNAAGVLTDASINPPIIGFSAQYPDASESNICITCHSGRVIGLNVKMASARGLNWVNTGTARVLVDHFRGASLMLFRPIGPNGKEMGAGFEFYTTASLYKNPNYSHPFIGQATPSPNGKGSYAGDSRGLGPCVGCHMNVKSELKANLSSHTFLPVNLEASATYLNDDAGMNQNPSKPITTIVSNACASCHTGQFSWTPASLQAEKDRAYATIAAFRELLLFALNANDITKRGAVKVNGTAAGLDADGRASLPTNYTAAAVQTWLRKPVQTTDNNGYPLTYTDPLDATRSGNVLFPAYTFGAAFNWYMLYYDPGAFAHNPTYVRRLIYDSMDWLDDGKLNQSVMDLFCSAPVFKDAAGNTVVNNGTKRSPVLSGTVASYSCPDNGITLTGSTDNFNMKTRLATAGVKTTPNGTLTGLVQQAPIDMQLAIDYLLKGSAGLRP